MEVTRCQACGFCFGVNRAIQRAEALARMGWNVFIDGDLVHNTSVMNDLDQKDIRVWNGESRHWRKNDCILIRAHGISLARRKFLNCLGCKIFDATCPEVGKIAGRILQLKKNHHILLYGDVKHPETHGLAAYGDDSLTIVTDGEDERILQKFSRIALLSQTTADQENFLRFAERIRIRFPQVQVFNTICSSTRNRQNNLVQHLGSQEFDCVIVVGGKHSSNTQKLAKLAEKSGIPTLHIEAAVELSPKNFKNMKKVLLTAGASTPTCDISAVEEFLKKL